jgi:hypothetical protein
MRCHRDRNAAINRMRFAASSAVTVSREEAEVRSGCGDAYDRAVNAARNIPRVSLKRQALRLDRLPAVGDVKILQVSAGGNLCTRSPHPAPTLDMGATMSANVRTS